MLMFSRSLTSLHWAKIMVLLLAIIIGWLFISYGSQSQQLIMDKSASPINSIPTTFVRNEREMIYHLVQMCKKISRAHRYSRDRTSMDYLNKAFRLSTGILKKLFEYLENKALASDELEVLPEVYMGMMYGYPYYEKGFELNENYSAAPIQTMLTILINAVTDLDVDQLKSFLRSHETFHRNLTVLVAISPKDIDSNDFLPGKYGPTVKFIKYHSKDGNGGGNVWRHLAKLAETKYILVGRALVYIDALVNFHRLLRMASYLKIDIVAGSHRTLPGHWSRACFSSDTIMNKTLRIIEGYANSYKSCIFCDYASGPFVTTKNFFISRLDANKYAKSDDMLFVDFFTNFGPQQQQRKIAEKMTTMVCPDVMFVVRENQVYFDLTKTRRKDMWVDFAEKFDLNKIILPSDDVILL